MFAWLAALIVLQGIARVRDQVVPRLEQQANARSEIGGFTAAAAGLPVA